MKSSSLFSLSTLKSNNSTDMIAIGGVVEGIAQIINELNDILKWATKIAIDTWEKKMEGK